MKKLSVLFVSLLLVVGMSAPAFASTTYTITGFFTMLSAAGKTMENTSSPYYASVPYYGYHTPIAGTFTDFTDGGVHPSGAIPFQGGAKIGAGMVNSFNFFNGSLPAVAKGIDALSPGSYTFNGEAYTVAPNTMGAHMLFDWNGTQNIDVVLSLDNSGNGMSVFPDSHMVLTHNNGPFSFASLDDQGDGIIGHPMWNGPFGGSNAVFDFNITGLAVPEPASLLLLGSGLLGLIGISRRRNKK